MKNTLYVLVGVPGSGKSTWIKNQDWAVDIPVVSTDDFVEAYAKEQHKTYNDVFDEYMKTAVGLMAEKVNQCKKNNQDIIWDQTSTTVRARAKKFRMCPDYYKIAVVFQTPDKDELQRRLSSRPGKNIPKHVQEVMASQLKNEPPTLEEGFDEIWNVQ